MSSGTSGPGTVIEDTWTNVGDSNGEVTYTIDVVSSCPSLRLR